MYSYAAFGLCIHSEIELSGFAPGEGEPDITLRRRDLTAITGPSRPVHEGSIVSGRIQDEEWELDLLFYMEGGKVVYFHSLLPIGEEMLRSFVQGALLAGVLRQRHLLVLHGSAVSDGERAIAFLGNSGWGKSTMAEYFCQRGYELITDDVMVIHSGSDTEPALVPPGIKEVRLRPSAAERLVPEFEALPFVTPLSPKRLRILKGEERRAIPLTKIYVLQRDTAAENRLVPLDPQQATLHFIAHTHATNWLTEPAYVTEHLRLCAQLSKHTPASQLQRVLSLNALPSIFALVQADLKAGAGEGDTGDTGWRAEPSVE